MINRHLIRGELRQNIKNLSIWTGVALAFTLMVMAFFPSVKEAGKDLANLLESMPEGLLRGMGMDELMMTSSIGFYKVYYGIYIVVILGIYLFSTGASIFAKEEANQTIEFIMSKPISRKNYFFSKCGSLLILYLLIVLIQALFAFISLSFADSEPLDYNTFIVLHAHGGALLFFFMSLGVLSSVLVHPRVNFMGIAVGVVFGSYLINALSQGAPDLQWLGYISPFYYTDFNVAKPNYEFNFISSCSKILLGIILIYIAFKRFERRDFLTL